MSTISKHLVDQDYRAAPIEARARVNISCVLDLNKFVCLPVAGVLSATAFYLEKSTLITERVHKDDGSQPCF